ncbi:MAG TPA: patatin-like phospholipase family protein [Methylomirabilota bacterium]|nr:patatin-like phospholipase family protein [Methylomirabilota bacterium]
MAATNGTKVNLIMGGGGVRLSAYVGALAAFRDMGVSFGAVAGASAGSIVGALVAAGWPVDRIYAKLLETDFAAFKDVTIKGLLLEGGIYSGNAFERWVDQQIKGARFADLPHDLFVTAVDLIGHQPVFFSRQTTPDMAVSRAVRCSMAIPWVWRPLRLDKRLLADGQLLPWIPTGLEMMEASPGAAGSSRTMMLRLMSRKPKEIPDKRVLWPWDFAKILLDTMLTALENQRVPGPLWQDTILIQADRVHTLQLSLSREDKEYLFQCGYDQAKRYFHKAPADGGAPAAS